DPANRGEQGDREHARGRYKPIRPPLWVMPPTYASLPPKYAQAEQTGREDGERGRLGDRVEGVEAGTRNVRRRGRERAGPAVGAPERGQGAVEGRERIAAAKGVCSRDDITVGDVVGKFELELRVGKLCWRQSHLIDNCILTVSLVDPSELQHGTGISFTYPQ